MSDVLFRVRFVSQDQVYELYAKRVFQSDLLGFVALEGFVFDTATTVVLDPSEEKLKSEFAGVERTLVPMHSVIRIDQVDKQGIAKIRPLGDVVMPFPGMGVPGAPVGGRKPDSDD